MSNDQEKQTCFRCDRLLKDCKCRRTETYNEDKGPICPWCGHINEACDSDGLLYTQNTDSYYCDHCDKEFAVTVYVSFAWSSYKSNNQ